MSRFRKELSHSVDRAREEATRRYREALAECYRRVREKTPVDSGTARGNWRCAIGEPDEGFDPLSRDPAGTLFRDRAKTAFSGIELDQRGVISNSAPYVNLLENGDSGQAPTGMVGTTVEEIRYEYDTDRRF